jgi:hypothetical protein
MSGRLHGETDEGSQQCGRVGRQIGIAAKMLEHEPHEAFTRAASCLRLT